MNISELQEVIDNGITTAKEEIDMEIVKFSLRLWGLHRPIWVEGYSHANDATGRCQIRTDYFQLQQFVLL